MRLWSVAAAVLAVATSAQAASKVVQYGPAPVWVGQSPTPTNTAPPAGAAAQVLYVDNQVRLGSDGDEFYTAYRIKVLTPEALPLGNISATWSPDTDDIRIHMLKIIRGGRVIDVLATTRFTVLQRENNLEHSILNGDLTANLQTPGLQVGDELEFATTIKRRDPTLGDRSQGGLLLPPTGAPGAYRVRLTWPRTKTLRWRATPDLGELKPADEGLNYTLGYELRDPKTAIMADEAPPRVNLRRFLQFSGFASWGEVSNLLWPLFERASTLAPESPIKAEAAKIAATTDDPAERAAAALRLVQERIRYVYVGLDGGNYHPAAADETWTRRFGDCKAKTALLLALLRELGVPAEAALVNAQGGDGMNETLPMLGAFDHIVVRATIGGQVYWLDGTRLGDRKLSLLPPPQFRWALPVRAGGVDLVKVEPEAPLLPAESTVLRVDASKGFDVPAKYAAEEVIRGDAALMFKTGLSQMSKEDADRFLRAYWVNKYSEVEPDAVSWRYDEAQNMALITMTGEGMPEWEGDEEDGRSLDVYAAGMSRPAEFKRPKEQDQTAPWVTQFPAYRRWTTVIHLPLEEDGWTWGYRASEMNERIGGVSYWRDAELRDGVLRTTMSRRVFKPEITAEEAQEANRKRTSLDNRISQVFQYKPEQEPDLAESAAKAAAKAGNDPDKLSEIGEYLIGAGRQADAVRVFDKALAADPAFKRAIQGKASALEGQGLHAKAFRLLDDAVRTNPDPELGLARGRAMMKMGKADEGFAAMEAVVAAHADDADVLAAFVEEAREAGRRDRALAVAEQALKLTPKDAYLLQVRAWLYSADGRWAEALPDIEAALRLDPEEAGNFRNRAIAFRHLGRLDEALADLDEALRIKPFDGETLNDKVRTLRLAGRKDEAAAVYAAADLLDRSSTGLNNRCWERSLSNIQLAEAEADCAEAVKLKPKYASYWDSYALVAFRSGRFDEALRRYNQALALNPKAAGALYGRGLTKLRQGDEAGGRADIAAAKAISSRVAEDLTEAGIAP